MKKLHVTDLSDDEFTAVFRAAARDAVQRAIAKTGGVPSHSWTTSEKAEAVPAVPKLSVKSRRKAVA
jgi:hypothetical protein